MAHFVYSCRILSDSWRLLSCPTISCICTAIEIDVYQRPPLDFESFLKDDIMQCFKYECTYELFEICKGTFLSEDTDVFVITSNERFSSLKLKIWFLVIFKTALDSQMCPSCPYKPQSWSNFQSPKFKFSISGKKNVRLFDFYDKNISIFWQKHTFTYFKKLISSFIFKTLH